MFLNGQFVPEQENITPQVQDISRFLKDENVTVNLKQYPKRHPTENIKFGVYKQKYSYLTENAEKNDSHQAGIQIICDMGCFKLGHHQIFVYVIITN